MVIPFLTARRRRKLLERPFSEARERVLEENVSLYSRLPEAARGKLRDLTRVFIAEKSFEGCGGVKVSDEMKLTIAAQASLLLLGLGLDPLRDELYPNLQSVLVYPAGFQSSAMKQAGPAGIVSEGFTNLGEAWHQGPVILSWADAKRGSVDGSGGHNVVLHEFAHKLDMLDGSVNGTPLLDSVAEVERWKNVMTREYIHLSRAAAMGVSTVLSPYGATSPGEFFAVATETFFGRPADMKQQHPELYETLAGYFKQDPAAWDGGSGGPRLA
ncbi:MAG: zinc-dependent peptidase [Phycisphaerales bacterium]|nr:zinc-dependent peptidase [Phycisphaerales bacterium]